MVFRVLMMAALALTPAIGVAQTAAPIETSEVDPIKCWWRTGSAAVRVGEVFTIGLTCAVLETETVQVVPDETQLGETAIQLSPFEIVSGSHPPDIQSGNRRFFQYLYNVRALNPDTIGQDVSLPPVVIHYKVSSQLPGNAALQGRDLTYLLNPQTVRVLSMVPSDANDIRDTSEESFDRVEGLNLRARVLEIAAIGLVTLASLMAITALIGLARRSDKAAKAVGPLVSEWSALGLAARELARVEREADGGWTGALAARALAALRIAAAHALDRPVSQRRADAGEDATEGGLLLRRRRPGARPVVVSSSVTSQEVARQIDRLPASASASRRQLLENLAAAMATFTSAQFSAKPQLDRAALSAALSSGMEATRRLRTARIWPRPQLRRWTTRVMEAQRQA